MDVESLQRMRDLADEGIRRLQAALAMTAQAEDAVTDTPADGVLVGAAGAMAP